MAKGKKQTPKNDKLQNALVLYHYMLNYFGCHDFKALSDGLKDPALEGVDENGISKLYFALRDHLFLNEEKKALEVLEYDHHIVRFTEEINLHRRNKIRWKYYQYLSFLFTEIFLDRCFRDKKGFIKDLNDFLINDFDFRNDVWQGVPEFKEENLNKLAYWCATGSGKTLMMHVHIKQFLYYARKYKKKDKINNIILLTPNEELSQQHLAELQRSNIGAEIFSKGNVSDLFRHQQVQIIEITKLGDTDGEKTVSVDSFENHNLVLIDEAHKGSSGDVWMKYRNKLTEKGFSFEYSATFGQAIGALGKKDKEELLKIYGQSTIFDYSYRYFYNDGYGKDYRIMNMKEWQDQKMLFEYLTAYLLCLYEQKLAFRQDRRIENDFLISNPLAVFVGGSVSVSNTKNAWGVSDVVLIILFFKNFLEEKDTYCRYIRDILNGTTSLTDKNGYAVFDHSFKKLKRDADYKTFGLSDADGYYRGILKEVFHTVETGALHLDVLKGSDGEVALRVGNDEYFGLLYVGDTKKVREMCVKNGLIPSERSFCSKSFFASISENNSPINILIGSKKFAEGWSCWRVSLMGLMNFGKSEGSMIIQMFGRGVRLKGYGMSLKRSGALDESIRPDADKMPKDLKVLETLNIFGICADYMDQFKAYLEDEGLPANDSDFIEFTVKTIKSEYPKDLKIIRVDQDYNFKKEVIVRLSDYINKVDVTLDWYPHIDLTESQNLRRVLAVKQQHKLEDVHLRYLDWDEVFFAIEQFKNERSWYNLELDANELHQLMINGMWYTLKIPEENLRFKDYASDVATWQEITISLLKLFVDKAYRKCQLKNMSEHQHVEMLTDNDPNFVQEYDVEVSRKQENWIGHIQDICDALKKGDFTHDINVAGNHFEGVTALQYARHLYNPIFYMNNSFAKNMDRKQNCDNWISISPVALNDGERNFIETLKGYFSKEPTIKEVYLLRNVSKKGLGFFENEGFYPDFILWIKDADQRKQYVTFIDPKGIRNLAGLQDEKVQLYKRLTQDIAPRLNDPQLVLNSFIISNTAYNQVLDRSPMEKYNQNHVFFQEDHDYVKKMIKMIVNG